MLPSAGQRPRGLRAVAPGAGWGFGGAVAASCDGWPRAAWEGSRALIALSWHCPARADWLQLVRGESTTAVLSSLQVKIKYKITHLCMSKHGINKLEAFLMHLRYKVCCCTYHGHTIIWEEQLLGQKVKDSPETVETYGEPRKDNRQQHKPPLHIILQKNTIKHRIKGVYRTPDDKIRVLLVGSEKKRQSML